MFTDEELEIIYSAIKDTVFLNSMDHEVQLKLLRDQDAAYELMRSRLHPEHDRATLQPVLD